MRGLRPSIRNKIVENLIKVYSTMVSSAAAIEKTLNETRKITNPNPNVRIRVLSLWALSIDYHLYLLFDSS